MWRTLVMGAGATALAVTLAVGQQSLADSGGSENRRIELQDDCDPATFNAAEVPCVGDGDTEFDEFIESLAEGDPDGHWRNHPKKTHVRRGGQLTVTNDGGEFHTFTEVAKFGAGCVPQINDLLGLDGPPAADCDAAFSDPQTALLPGASGTVSTADLKRGIHRFMCMIHPWMQTTVEVRHH